MRWRVFVLSPASLKGVRGRRILEEGRGAPFVEDLLAGGTVALGEVYAHISSLYYRGKQAYARRFGERPGPGPVAWVITPTQGLVPETTQVDMKDLRAFAGSDIDPANSAYREAVVASARRLHPELGPETGVVLLGSIATAKYVEPLAGVFGQRLLFPRSFVGRGDMSRGGLLLRAAASGQELEYVVATDARRRGARPPRLDPEGRPGG